MSDGALFYRLRCKKLLLEHLTDPQPFNNQFWTNAAFRGGENTGQQDLSTAVLNCKYLGWVNQKTQHGGEMPSWSPGSRMGLAPACCFSSSARAPVPMGTWRSLQREGRKSPLLQGQERKCRTQRAPLASTSSSCCATSTSCSTAGQTSPPSQLYATATWEQGFPVPPPSWACRKAFPAVLLSCW